MKNYYNSFLLFGLYVIRISRLLCTSIGFIDLPGNALLRFFNSSNVIRSSSNTVNATYVGGREVKMALLLFKNLNCMIISSTIHTAFEVGIKDYVHTDAFFNFASNIYSVATLLGIHF